MVAGIFRTAVLSLVLLVVAAPMASAAKSDKKGDHGPIAIILKHADELKLTADQKSQLEGLKGLKDKKELKSKIKAILDAAQEKKVKEYLKEHKKK